MTDAVGPNTGMSQGPTVVVSGIVTRTPTGDTRTITSRINARPTDQATITRATVVGRRSTSASADREGVLPAELREVMLPGWHDLFLVATKKIETIH